MVTYENQSPSEIRTGDTVIDSLGRVFTAFSDSVFDMGDYQVLGITDTGEERWFTLDSTSNVTISYDESAWHEDVYT